MVMRIVMKKISFLGMVGLLSVSEVTQAENFSANVDYLFWNVDQANMVYALVVDSVITLAHEEARSHPSQCASGFRIGAGYDFPCLWETYFSWTRLHHCSRDKIFTSNIIATPLLSPNFNSLFVGGPGSNGGAATSEWTLNFDSFDLQFSYPLSENQAFFFEPILGIKGVIFNQSQNMRFNHFFDVSTDAFVSATARQINRYWGIGPSAGFNSAYCIGWGVSLLGEFSLTALYGRLPSKSVTVAEESGGVAKNTFILNTYRAIPALQFLIGLDWNTQIKGFPVSLTLGYETQYFWGLWRKQNSNIQNIYHTNAGYDALLFNGLTVSAALAF